ncbi:MAG: hypothetical protein ABIJ85_03460 [bacterium]
MEQKLVHLNTTQQNKLLHYFLLSLPIFLFFTIIAVLFVEYEAHKLPLQQKETVLGNQTENFLNK